VALPADVRAALRRRDADLTRLGDRIGAELIGLRDTLRDRLIELAEVSGGGDWRTGLLAVQLDQVAAAVAEETGEIQDQWLDGLDDIERATPDYLRSVGLDPDNVIDVEALAAVIDAARRDAIDAFRTANLTTATDLVPLMREGYRLESLTELTTRLSERLQVSLGQAATEARTQTAVYARAISNAYADESGVPIGFAYGGPDDGLTRPFCAVCVGHWFSPELVRGLDNGQNGLPHPLESGGGYNCRHQWLAVPQAVALRWGYEVATEATVRAANTAARG
jgi:hypothetical protein